MAINEGDGAQAPSLKKEIDPLLVPHIKAYNRGKLNIFCMCICRDVLDFVATNSDYEEDPMYILDVNRLEEMIGHFRTQNQENSGFNATDYLYQIKIHVQRMKQLYRIPSLT